MAMGFCGKVRFSRSGNRASLPPPHARDCHATCPSGGRASVRNHETGDLPHASAFVCDAPPARRLRHPDGAGAPGAQRRQDHDDLHACLESGRSRRAQPGRPSSQGGLKKRIRAIRRAMSGSNSDASRPSGRPGPWAHQLLFAMDDYPADNEDNSVPQTPAASRNLSSRKHFACPTQKTRDVYQTRLARYRVP